MQHLLLTNKPSPAQEPMRDQYGYQITGDDTPDDLIELTRGELCDICEEIENQPFWRAKADREMDFVDGNQLDSELLRKQAEIGIPPAVENIIAPTIKGIVGMEAKTRTDWRLTPDGGQGGQDVSDALNFKLNQAERQSGADKACSEAFRYQTCIGVGFVEVSREGDPTKFPYRCAPVHRGELFWDMTHRDDKRLLKARWMLRKRWMHPRQLAMVFPHRKADILTCGRGQYGEWGLMNGLVEGLSSTGLRDGTRDPRGWTVAEQQWYDPQNNQVCVYEVWYRRWVNAVFLRAPDGRVVEFDQANPAHMLAAQTGSGRLMRATVARIRRAYWMGPMQLHDGFTPYNHPYFPYVPFWNQREDATGVPYGEVRSMMYPQETLNSAIAKLRWGLSAVRTERTKGAVHGMTDEQHRKAVARIDADIILDAQHMAQPGARYTVERDFQLSEQHYKLVEDARMAIQRVGPATSAFLGKAGTARSGIQEQTQAEQSNQTLAGLMDEFKEGRTVVGEILLSMIIEDIGEEQEIVVIEGDAIREERVVVLNGPEVDPKTGMPYRSNDVQRTRLKVALEDVPTTSSFRAQQLQAMSETMKSMPPEMQKALTPFMVALMDLPYKREVVEAVRAAGTGATEDDIQQRIADAVKAAGLDIKREELERKFPRELIDAQIRKVLAEVFKTNGTALYEAIQTANTLSMNPAAAPLADHTAKIAGFQEAPGGQDPNFPVEGLPQPVPGAMPPAPPPGVVANTDPTEPPVPQQPPGPSTGIETPTLGDGPPRGFTPQGGPTPE